MTNTIISMTIIDSQGKWQFKAINLPLKIGNLATPTINLVVNGKFVSGEHCEIYEEQGQLYLKDYSRNGTYVNGRHINHNTCPLRENDTVQLCKIKTEEYDKYPLITINSVQTSAMIESTPVSPTPTAPTIVAHNIAVTDPQMDGQMTHPQADDKPLQVPFTPIPPILRLSLTADGYSQTINVMDLPCLIGRCPIDGDYPTRVYTPSYYYPNQQLPTDPKLKEVSSIVQDSSAIINTVSRSHLVICSFDGITAKLINLGHHSCRVNDLSILEDEFKAEVDDIITLGHDSIPTKIQLKFDMGCAV